MTIEKLERVMERCRRKVLINDLIAYMALKRAIMMEIGVDVRTYHKYVGVLRTLGWIARHSKTMCKLTNKDLIES